ncbi:MAG: hypothetical protein ABSB63_14185 [Spirochaetia bacterium]|jgi:hypothetical protein
MRIARNPFMDEGVRTYFVQQTILRSYLALVGVVGVALLLWWPRTSFDAVVRTGVFPGTFTSVAIGLYVCLTYLGARYGSEGFSPEAQVQLRDYALLTPVPLASIVAGKALFALLHTLFLLSLGAPFLLASLAVSGGGLSLVLPALLVIGAATFAVRMYGLLTLVLLERQVARDVALAVGTIMFLIISALVVPAANPIVAILSILTRDGTAVAPISLPFGSIPFFSLSVIMSLLAALLLAGTAYASLGGIRSRERPGKNGTQ